MLYALCRQKGWSRSLERCRGTALEGRRACRGPTSARLAPASSWPRARPPRAPAGAKPGKPSGPPGALRLPGRPCINDDNALAYSARGSGRGLDIFQMRKETRNHPWESILGDIFGIHHHFRKQPEQRNLRKLVKFIKGAVKPRRSGRGYKALAACSHKLQVPA